MGTKKPVKTSKVPILVFFNFLKKNTKTLKIPDFRPIVPAKKNKYSVAVLFSLISCVCSYAIVFTWL